MNCLTSYFLSNASSFSTLALMSKNSSHSSLLLPDPVQLLNWYTSSAPLLLHIVPTFKQIKQYFWSILYHNLTLPCPVPSMLFVIVLNVAIYLLALNFPPSFSFLGVLIALIIIPSNSFLLLSASLVFALLCFGGRSHEAYSSRVVCVCVSVRCQHSASHAKN